MVIFVHPEVRCGSVITGDHLHAENICGKILPSLHIAGADPYIAKLRHAYHGDAPFQMDPIPNSRQLYISQQNPVHPQPDGRYVAWAAPQLSISDVWRL